MSRAQARRKPLELEERTAAFDAEVVEYLLSPIKDPLVLLTTALGEVDVVVVVEWHNDCLIGFRPGPLGLSGYSGGGAGVGTVQWGAPTPTASSAVSAKPYGFMAFDKLRRRRC